MTLRSSMLCPAPLPVGRADACVASCKPPHGDRCTLVNLVMAPPTPPSRRPPPAGALTATFVCPLDVLKTQLQVSRIGSAKRLGIAGGLKQIMHQEGIKGLYRGLTPTLMALLPNWAVRGGGSGGWGHAHTCGGSRGGCGVGRTADGAPPNPRAPRPHAGLYPRPLPCTGVLHSVRAAEDNAHNTASWCAAGPAGSSDAWQAGALRATSGRLGSLQCGRAGQDARAATAQRPAP